MERGLDEEELEAGCASSLIGESPVNTDLYWRFFSLFLAVILWVIGGRPSRCDPTGSPVDLEVVRAAEGALVSLNRDR